MTEQKHPLSLSPRVSTLNGLSLTEPIDTAILEKLLRSDLLKTEIWDEKAGVQRPYTTEREQLTLYSKRVVGGKAVITYRRAKGMDYGRCNPENGLGLFGMRRELRHTLAKGRFKDLDIENAHPVILQQICESNAIDCVNLAYYIDHREEVLAEVMAVYGVNRDWAKRLFICLLYCGGFKRWCENLAKETGNYITAEPSLLIVNYAKELQTIAGIITNKNKDILKLLKKKKEEKEEVLTNPNGSVLSYYLQEIECRLLEAVFVYAVANGYIQKNVAVLCADGIMIEAEYFKEGLLTAFETVCREKEGFHLRFTEKEMEQDYLAVLDDHLLTDEEVVKEVMGGYDCSLSINEDEDFSIHRFKELFFSDLEEIPPHSYIENFHLTKSFKYFNAYHSHFYIANRVHKHYKNIITPYADFNTTFDPLHFMMNNKRVLFTTLYNNSKHKRSYSTMEFKPKQTEEQSDKYNLFRGFEYETEDNTSFDPEIVKPFLDHILFICRGDISVWNYFLNWLAHIIQKPHIKTKVAILLYSDVEGVGKNIIGDIFTALLKGYTAKLRDTSALTDRFNAELMGKLFVVGDEISARASDIANELKDIITREILNIEMKGRDKVIMEDLLNYLFTTNGEITMKTSQSDRRMMYIECPDEKKSVEYYARLFAFKDNKNCLKHLFNWFMSRDITTFNPTELVMTDYKRRLILNNTPAYIRMIKDKYDWLSGKKWKASDLFEESIEFAKANRLPWSYTEQTFYKQFGKIFGDYKELFHSGVSGYKFPEGGKEAVMECIKQNYLP